MKENEKSLLFITELILKSAQNRRINTYVNLWKIKSYMIVIILRQKSFII